MCVNSWCFNLIELFLLITVVAEEMVALMVWAQEWVLQEIMDAEFYLASTRVLCSHLYYAFMKKLWPVQWILIILLELHPLIDWQFQSLEILYHPPQSSNSFPWIDTAINSREVCLGIIDCHYFILELCKEFVVNVVYLVLSWNNYYGFFLVLDELFELLVVTNALVHIADYFEYKLSHE